MAFIYPDLQNIENKFKKEILKIINKPRYMDFDITLFSQMWPNTGTGFCEPGYMYGQAFTKEYTVIISLDWIDEVKEISRIGTSNDSLYGVFFGEKPAYIIRRPNKKFFNDMHKFNMLGIMGCETYKDTDSELYIINSY